MPASAAVHLIGKPRNRSIEARRAARHVKFERKRLIIDFLNRGVSIAEIAERLGVSEKRMRALVKEILARRMPQAPQDFIALQASRLNEALHVAYGAMSDKNLEAVALVVRIVRELDRYHGFVPAERRPRRGLCADGEAEAPALAARGRETPTRELERVSPRPPDAGSERAQGLVPAAAEKLDAPAAPPVLRPELAPQDVERVESAPENGAAEAPLDAALPETGAGPRDKTFAPPAAPAQSDRASAAPPCDGP